VVVSCRAADVSIKVSSSDVGKMKPSKVTKVSAVAEIIPGPFRDASILSSGTYFSKHSWMKAWGDRSAVLAKGKTERKLSVPKAPEDCSDFRFPRTCTLYTKMKKDFNMKCPGMHLKDVREQTQLICSHCLVFLHAECHMFYHMHYAKDRLQLL
jgi:hypothetical protein